jgi:hypothetical protein
LITSRLFCKSLKSFSPITATFRSSHHFRCELKTSFMFYSKCYLLPVDNFSKHFFCLGVVCQGSRNLPVRRVPVVARGSCDADLPSQHLQGLPRQVLQGRDLQLLALQRRHRKGLQRERQRKVQQSSQDSIRTLTSDRRDYKQIYLKD